MSQFRKIFSKTLFKVASLNGVSIIIKIVLGFISSKFIAVFLGPSGMALMGNFRFFLTSVESFGTLGFDNGIIKYVAESKEDQYQFKKTISTVFVAVLSSILLISLLLVLLSNQINSAVFGLQYNFSFLFVVVALALPFYIGNIVLLSIINGLTYFKEVIIINIIGNCIGLLATISLIVLFKLNGALFGLVVTPSLLFFVSLYVINSKVKLLNNFSMKLFDFALLKNLASYSMMALVSALIVPLVYLYIRNYVIQNLGINQAGLWEGLSRISSYYFLLITSLVSIYFLPKLAVSKDRLETKTTFYSYYRNIIPFFILVLIAIYFLRDFLIKILFTPDFIPMSELFGWYILGDIFKAASLVLGVQFFAKKMSKAFIISELFSLAVMYCSCMYLIPIYKIEGVVMAHALTYFIYLVSLMFFFRKSLI